MEKSKICTKNSINLEGVYHLDEISDRLLYLREQFELTQGELAKSLKTTRNVIGRWERGEQLMNSRQITAVTRFYKISPEALLYGIKREQLRINQITGLSQKSIDWLNKVNRLSPEITETINQVLSNEEIASLLFECIYIYSNLNVPKVIVTEQNELIGRVSTYLSDEEALLTSAMTEQLANILTKIRKKIQTNDSTKQKRRQKLQSKNLAETWKN